MTAGLCGICRRFQRNKFDLSLLNVTSTVDTATPGIYEVHYEIGSAASAGAGDATDNEDAAEETPAEDSGALLTSVDGEGQYGQMWLTVIVQEVGPMKEQQISLDGISLPGGGPPDPKKLVGGCLPGAGGLFGSDRPGYADLRTGYTATSHFGDPGERFGRLQYAFPRQPR